jgi:hypothetical protein
MMAQHEVAVAAEGEGETALLLVGKRRAEGGRQIVADAGAAGETVPLMRLLEIPQPMRPGQPCRRERFALLRRSGALHGWTVIF